MDRIAALRRVLFLKPLTAPALDAVAAAARGRAIDRGEMLFCEGERCLGLVVVVSGAVKMYKLDSRGREMIIGIARPGESVGDLALFDGGNYPASAEAVESGTRVLVVPVSEFAALMARYPEIAAAAVRALAIQQRKLIEMLKAQTLHTVRARIAAYLLHLAGDSNEFPLHETNATIGSHVGTVREVVSRTLHALEDEGAIRLHGRTVVTLDRKALRRIAESEDLTGDRRDR